MICIKMLLTRHLEMDRDKIENVLLISRIVGKFLSVLISLSHMQAKLLLRVVFYTIFVG